MSPYFVVVFVSQIAILSFYHPKKLAETVLRNFSDVPDNEVASQWRMPSSNRSTAASATSA